MNLTPGVVDDTLAEEAKAEIDDLNLDAAENEAVPTEAQIGEEEACGPVSVDDVTEGPVVTEAANIVRVGTLGGADLFFPRGGTNDPQTFPVDVAFKDVLERTVRLVAARAPEEFGQLKRLGTAGMLVDKPGMHGVGRACDWDIWTFSDVKIAPLNRDHADPSQDVRRRYWALAALCRSVSSFVLHAEFNADHEDHIHQDNGGGSVRFNAGSQSTVKLVQSLCNEIYDRSPRLVVDGSLGSNTQAAIDEALDMVHLGGGSLTDTGTWRQFLRRTGRLGFRLSV